MANKRVIELDERTTLDVNDYLLVDSQTGTRKLALPTLFSYMTTSSIVFVTELPTTDISESTIYCMLHSGSNILWDMYIYRNNTWTIIGQSVLDFTSIYQTKTDNTLQTTSKQIVGAINEVNASLNRGFVRVTGNGVKTFGALAAELYALIDKTKITEYSMFNFRDISRAMVSQVTDTSVQAGCILSAQLEAFNLGASSGTWYQYDIITQTFTDRTLDVVNAGDHLTFYY